MLTLLDRGAELLQAMGGIHLKIFQEEFAPRFKKINFQRLRGLYWENMIDEFGRRRVPTATAAAAVGGEGGGGADANVAPDPGPPLAPKTWICQETLDNGAICGLEFTEQQG
eukprot:2597336-Pyramimonas_sp.AAC.1